MGSPSPLFSPTLGNLPLSSPTPSFLVFPEVRMKISRSRKTLAWALLTRVLRTDPGRATVRTAGARPAVPPVLRGGPRAFSCGPAGSPPSQGGGPSRAGHAPAGFIIRSLTPGAAASPALRPRSGRAPRAGRETCRPSEAHTRAHTTLPFTTGAHGHSRALTPARTRTRAPHSHALALTSALPRAHTQARQP